MMPTPNPDMSDLQDYMFAHDLNYYHNHDYIPNQELVFQTIDYFEQGDGKDFCTPIDFLNLMYWHYKFISDNLDRPYDVIKQVENLVAAEAGKHILIAFLLKWYGGYPVQNFNPKYNTILKLLEKKYLKVIQQVHAERQAEANKGLAGVDYSPEKMKELEQEAAFVDNLDQLVKNESKVKANSPVTTSVADPTIPLKNTIERLETENKSLKTKLNQKDLTAWFKNYGMWFAIISAAFLLGLYFGNNKFDAEKLRLNELVGKQLKSIDSLKHLKPVTLKK